MDQKIINGTEFLVKQFQSLDRLEVKIPGMDGVFYAKPMTFAEKMTLKAIHEEDSNRKQGLLMCKVIVDRTIDENGDKVFRNYDNQLAHVALADSCDGDTISDLFAQVVGADKDLDEEIEEVAGKSSDQDSD